MTLQYFPRGGKKTHEKPTSSSLDKHVNEKKAKRPTKNKNRKAETVRQEINNVAITAERLSNKTLQEGLIVLGRVREATEYNLTVCLPGGINARLPITNIHESYTKLLQNIVKSETELPSDFKPLSELYPVGQYIVCYIKAVKPDERWALDISLEPSLINQNIDSNFLTKNTKVVCTVTSKEDHGYVVDTGIRNVRGFIPLKRVESGKQYFPGKQLLCAIKEVKSVDNNLIITLSTKKKQVDKPSTCKEGSLDILMPGIKIELQIEKILSNGLQVSFGDKNVGYINQIYLDNLLASYSTDTTIIGTLMYIMPMVKFAYFTLLADSEETHKLDIGAIIPKATVLFREGSGIIFKLKNHLRGIVAMHRTDVDYTLIASKFKEGTRHDCRILAYDTIEKLYICTTQRELLERKYFTISDFTPGEIVNVTIRHIDCKSNSLKVAVGRIIGSVFSEHLSDNGVSILNKLKAGQQVTARVLHVDVEQNRVVYTLKQSLIQSNLPILQNIDEAECGVYHHGTVVQINKNGLLVRFFGNVKGWVPPNHLKKGTAKANWGYSIGDTVTTKIESVNKAEHKMLLSILKDEDKATKTESFVIGQNVVGTVIESGIEGVYLKIKKDDEETTETGFLPAGHMAPCPEVARLLASRCAPGDVMSALVFATMPTLLLTRTFVSQEEYRNFDTLKVGDSIPCSIRDISQDGIRVILPINGYSTFGFIAYNQVSNIDHLHVNQIVFTRIVSINRQEKQLGLTMSFDKIWHDQTEERSKMMAAVDSVSLYFNKLSELSENFYYKDRPISSVHLGQRVSGKVEKITDLGLIVKLDNNVQGTVRKDHYIGDIKVGDTVSGAILWINYVHEFVDLTLISTLINNISSKQDKLPCLPPEVLLRGEIVMITNWFVLVNIKGHGKSLVALPARRHINDIQPDLSPYTVWTKLRCYVVLNRDEADIMPICMLKSAFDTLLKYSNAPDVKENVKEENTKREIKAALKRQRKDDAELMEDSNEHSSAKRMKNDTDVENKKKGKISSDKDQIEKVEKSSKKNLNNDKNVLEAKTRLNDDEKVAVKNEKKTKRKLNEQEKVENKRKMMLNKENEGADEIKEKSRKEKEIDEATTEKLNKKKKTEKFKEKSTEPTPAEEESIDNVKIKNETDEKLDKQENITANISLPACGFHWDASDDETLANNPESSSDDEDDEEENSKRKKKKLSAAERRELERQKEREIREREEALASNQMPNSIDQFDRLVLSSPDSSLVWLQYMAYHLQATEIEKARAVARRALKTINFREEAERLNVWNAWLNLESKFGTVDSLNEVFQEAIRTNDSFKVYNHMLNVHIDAGRQIELEKTVNTMIAKFKQNPETWTNCGCALLKIGLKDKSRHIMQRALQSLPPSNHVNLIVRFAQLENKFGDKERSQTLFEQILTSYPKRVDVWSMYVDALIKSDDIDIARKVLERAVVQTLPARKMKTLFKKFITFEEQHGTPEGVERVKQMAADYVEKQTQKELV